jgi:hypothetical protein
MIFNKERHYRITKLAAHDPDKPSNILENHWVVGTLSEEPLVGRKVKMWRLANREHPEGLLGYFSTSAVEKIDKNENFWLISTRNSIYKLEEFQYK